MKIDNLTAAERDNIVQAIANFAPQSMTAAIVLDIADYLNVPTNPWSDSYCRVKEEQKRRRKW